VSGDSSHPKQEIITYWEEKAKECLAAARDEINAQRLAFAVGRAYFACFYAVSAALLKLGHSFRKHSGVRAAFHQQLVKPRRVAVRYGKLYDELFEARHRGDYMPFVSFEASQVEHWLEEATRLVARMRHLSGHGNGAGGES